MLYSFDIFDTLVTRKTATPTGIFCVVQDILRRDHSDVYPVDLVEDFYFYRTNAEQAARRKADGKEITLDQIYEMLFETFQHEMSRDRLWTIRDIEIETELQWVVPIPENVQKVHALLDRGERVVLISDMYLPSSLIRKMLESCDQRVAGCPIYVSCEAGVTKHGGGLFHHVSECENIRFEEWHHYGDNKHADHRVPCSMGIRTTLYERTALNEIEKSYLKKDVLFYQLYAGTSRLYRITHPHANDKQIVGASLAGPLLFPYVDFVLRDAQQRGIDRLYFLARDGQILLKIAQTINEQQNLNMDLRYLYCARQVCYLSGLFRVNEKTLERILQRDIRPSVEVISRRLGLSPEEMFSVLPDGIKKDIKDISTPYGKKTASKIKNFLLSDESVQERIAQVARQHRGMFISYLRQEGFFDQQSLGIVDMGWSGRMQDDFVKAAMDGKRGMTIHGYFFSVSSVTNGTSVQNFKHSAVSFPRIPVNPLECLTAANHGTTFGYLDKDDRIIPQTEQGEYLDQWGITELQGAALWFVHHYQETTKSIRGFGISPLSVESTLLGLLNRPSRWIASVLGTVPFSTDPNDLLINELAPSFSILRAIRFYFFRCGKPRSEYTNWIEGTLARSSMIVKGISRISKALKEIEKFGKTLERAFRDNVTKPLKAYVRIDRGTDQETNTSVEVVSFPTSAKNSQRHVA